MLQPSYSLPNLKFYFLILFYSMSWYENHRVNVLLVPASHVTNDINVFYRTYTWLLSNFGLLISKECITLLLCNGWICFSCKTYCIMYHWKDNFMLINICNRTYSWFLSVFGLLTLKEWVTWPWCKRWICFTHKIYGIWCRSEDNFI